MSKSSIAKSWFVNSFSVVVILLIIIDTCFLAFIKTYYYDAASSYLISEANVISSVLERIYETSSSRLSSEIRSTVENFDKKDRTELMAIDKNGNVVLSSSGFMPQKSYEMPDYTEAQKSKNKISQHIGFLENNEKYLAVTAIIADSSAPYSAIRLVSSLEKVDKQISSFVLFVGITSLCLLLLVLMLGFYFIKSIAAPLKEVSITAKKLAAGDFSGRVKINKNDEIGELCTVFNHLADELKNSDHIKNEFISSVSHELRTPLTAIKGWSETIIKMPTEETIIKGMKVITTETDRLSAMVEELLDFSRMQDGRLTLQKTNMDIIAELSDAVLVYEEKSKSENITINYTEPVDIIMVFGDKNRIRQLFINIIDNSIKYGKKNGLIVIEAIPSKDRREILISVTDNGVGISEEDLPKIKNRFYKANNSVRGSGIGLAVADEIIAMHGGTLTIESELGIGTTVKITLPTIEEKM